MTRLGLDPIRMNPTVDHAIPMMEESGVDGLGAIGRIRPETLSKGSTPRP